MSHTFFSSINWVDLVQKKVQYIYCFNNYSIKKQHSCISIHCSCKLLHLHGVEMITIIHYELLLCISIVWLECYTFWADKRINFFCQQLNIRSWNSSYCLSDKPIYIHTYVCVKPYYHYCDIQKRQSMLQLNSSLLFDGWNKASYLDIFYGFTPSLCTDLQYSVVSFKFPVKMYMFIQILI